MVLGVAGLALALRGLQQGGSAPQEAAPLGEAMPKEAEELEEDEEAREKPGQLKRFVVVTLILLAYILVFIPIGYLLSTFAFLAGASMYIDPKRRVRNLIFAALFAVVVYFAFTRGLRVQLPPGVLG
jgi:fatty acid desaturase